MKSKVYAMVICGLLVPMQAWALGDSAAIVPQLIKQLEVLHKHTKQLDESIDVSKRLEQMEEAKTVKKLYESGEQIRELLKETEALISAAEGLADDPSGIEGTEKELEDLLRRVRRANESDEKAKEYASILVSLKRLKFLGKAKDKTLENMSKGANEEETQTVIATNTAILADIVIEQEKRNQLKKTRDAERLEFMSQSGYEELYDDKKK